MYAIDEQEIAAIREAIASKTLFRYMPGSNAQLLESMWAEKMGTKYCLATTSGTASLICALSGADIGIGDEVIIPGYTFIATAAAVLAVGAIPILAEIDETLTLNAADVEKKITKYTKAIMPVHMQGLPSNMDAIMDVANRHGLMVIEDACQADGGSYKGKRLGSIAKAGANSFNFFKIIGAGEGGAMVTNDKTLYERAVIQHDCGNSFFAENPMSVPVFMGWNFRISEVLAALMRVQVGRLDSILSKLREEKDFFRKEIELDGRYRLSPSNDKAGDCGTTLSIVFDTSKEARAFASEIGKEVSGVTLPIDTGKHVYTNWQAVMQKNGAHNAASNPYNYAKRPIEYEMDMLPNTLDILARTVYIPMHVDHDRKFREKLLGVMLKVNV